jgi:hypothetical protein
MQNASISKNSNKRTTNLTCRFKLLQVFCVSTLMILAQFAANAQPPKVESDIEKGFKFTTGIGAIFIKKGDVTEAIADNGTVRIKSSEKMKLGMWLTANSFSGHWRTRGAIAGPFVGVQLGGEQNKIVNAFAAGIGIAASEAPNDSSPLVFNVGWGVTSRRSLVDPYIDGKPLPMGSSQPLLTSTTAHGPLLLVTYRFGTTN